MLFFPHLMPTLVLCFTVEENLDTTKKMSIGANCLTNKERDYLTKIQTEKRKDKKTKESQQKNSYFELYIRQTKKR